MGLLFNELNSKSIKAVQIDLQNSEWTAQVVEGPPIQIGRGSHAGGLVAGKVIVAGGTSWNAQRTIKSFLKGTEVFEKDAWSNGPDLPTGLAEGAFAQDDTGLYLAGGLSAPDTATKVACYLTSVDGNLEVRRLPDFPVAISACDGAIADGKFYVICGQLDGRTATNRVWSLDLSSKDSKWTESTPLPGAGRAYPGVVVCGGSIYVLGGLADGTGSVHDRTLSDALRYDPKTGHWSVLGTLPIDGYCWSADPIDTHHILLTGRADGHIHDEVWLLDLRTLGASLIGRTVIQASCAPLIKVSNDTWWLIGGEPDSNENRTNRISEISLR